MTTKNKLPFIKLPLLIIIGFPFFLASCNSMIIKFDVTPIPEIEFDPTTPAVTQTQNCFLIPTDPTPEPDEESLFSRVQTSDHIFGGVNAIITIIEYGDFQCPDCSELSMTFRNLVEKFPSEVRIVFRSLPLYDIHDKALHSARALEAAGLFGKYWEMHQLLSSLYPEWESLTPDSFDKWIVIKAEALGINKDQFSEAYKSNTINEIVMLSLEQALRSGLRSTPFLLINGQIYNGPRDEFNLEQIIQLIILGERQYSICPEFNLDLGKQYYAILHTEKGDIRIGLFPDKAPLAVNSFVFLARNGWYDGITFHYVVKDYLAQTGDPSGTGLGKPGYVFDNEIDSSLDFSKGGVVAMDNSGSNLNGSQFFITYKPLLTFNNRYTIIGQVIDGMVVLERLTPRNALDGTNPPLGDKLLSVEIVEK